jgi:hypothetical protein
MPFYKVVNRVQWLHWKRWRQIYSRWNCHDLSCERWMRC